MSEKMQTETTQAPQFTPRLYALAILVSAVILSGLWMVSRFVAADYARDLQNWHDKLDLIAESRTADVGQWLGDHFASLRTLANNPSLQIYMAQLQAPAKDKSVPASGEEPAPKSYLRNLLVFSAEHSGFSAPSATAAIPANIPATNKSGVVILGNDNQIVVSTAMPEATRELILSQSKFAQRGKEELLDLKKDKDGTPYIGFSVPVFSIQGDHNADAQIGRVVGILTVGDNLFSLLKHSGASEKTLEAILVRRTDNSVEFLSPLQNGTAAMGKQEAFDTQKFAEATLINTNGTFLPDQKDYRDRPVMGTSRAIAGVPWTLVVKIDRKEALASGNEHRASMVAFFILIIAVVVMMILALWWYAHSRRSMLMSAHFRRMANHAQAQERLLRLVTDNQPEALYIIDRQQVLHFANRQAASNTQMSEENIAGKSLADVRGSARAGDIVAQCEAALAQHAVAYAVARTQDDGAAKIIRSAYVPLDHIPVAGLPEPTPGVLVVEQDISDAVRERERRLETHRQLVDALVRLVDKRDPFAANHSQIVSQLAREVALAMELDTVTVEAAHIAGSLMNIGKIVVPPELLTKTGSLNNEEKRIIRESLHAAADILSGISFDAPVAETLRQWQEKWDGTGPLGIKGDAILLPARIIAASNAFIGMISPRSWRTAMPVDAASKFLLDQSDTFFDRRVVVALVDYVENHSGRAWIRNILESQKVA